MDLIWHSFFTMCFGNSIQ